MFSQYDTERTASMCQVSYSCSIPCEAWASMRPVVRPIPIHLDQHSCFAWVPVTHAPYFLLCTPCHASVLCRASLRAYCSTSPLPYCPSQYLVASKRTADGNRRTTSRERQTRECRETLTNPQGESEEPVVRLQAERSEERKRCESPRRAIAEWSQEANRLDMQHIVHDNLGAKRTSSQRVSQRWAYWRTGTQKTTLWNES